MSAGLMNALMAGSSFGTGLVNEQDRMAQLAMQRQQFNQQSQAANMALMMNGLKLQDEQRNMGYAQEESDYARQLAADPDTMDLPADQRMDLLAKSALKSGDVVRANEFAVNASNLRQAQTNQLWRQQLTTSNLMANQQRLHNFMGSTLATAADTGDPEQFRQALDIAIDSGNGSPQDQANLRYLRDNGDFSPEGLRKMGQTLRMGAMNARQQAQTTESEARQASIDKNRELIEKDRLFKEDIARTRTQIAQEELERKQKAGGAAKAPTENEMNQAAAFLKDTGLKGTDLTQVQRSIIDIAGQWRHANPNLTGAQALQKAVDGLKGTDIRFIDTPSKIPGIAPKRTVEYKMQGVTQDSPIIYTGDPNTLIPGRYYRNDKGVVAQFTGTGFKPIQ